MFDKSKIKTNFNQANSSYNKNAILQKIVAKNLISLAEKDIVDAQNIIDLGCGTGFLANEIINQFPDKKIFQLDIAEKMLIANPFPTYKIVADIENLPFQKNIFDLGLSSLTFQWLNDLKTSLPAILKTLKKDSNFYFSTLGSESLKELKSSCEDCQIKLSINDFVSEEELKTILYGHNYQIKSEIILMDYQDCYALLKSIKSIGASYGNKHESLNKTQFNLLNNFYLKNFNLEHKVFASWQIFYVSITVET